MTSYNVKETMSERRARRGTPTLRSSRRLSQGRLDADQAMQHQPIDVKERLFCAEVQHQSEFCH